tara:strand:- start:1004 stop:1582 length:579 start_codon:yes stop_codon:yes gene_type:complete
MNTSINNYDLMYLANNHVGKRNELKSNGFDEIFEDDVKFYKKRIIKQNLDLLNGENDIKGTPMHINYKRYLRLTIQNFKMLDRNEIIQKDYVGIKGKKSKEKKFYLDDTNKMLEKNMSGKITDKLDIKIRYNKEKGMLIPKKRIINLRDEHLRTKGLKKENVSIIVDNAFDKKEKEQTEKTDKKEEEENKKI